MYILGYLLANVAQPLKYKTKKNKAGERKIKKLIFKNGKDRERQRKTGKDILKRVYCIVYICM